MKVHRCPHCNKPFLESEVRDGYCPVCRQWVRDEPEPKPEPEPPTEGEPGPQAGSEQHPAAGPGPLPAPPEPPKEDQSPDRLSSPPSGRPIPLAVPLLLAVILTGAVVWWLQVRDLTGRLNKAVNDLEAAEQRAREAEQSKTETEDGAARALTNALGKEDLAQRMQAALALARIRPGHRESQAILVDGMQRDPAWTTAVSKLSPPPQWAVSTLITVLRHPDPDARRLASEALGRIRPTDPITRIALTKATRDREPTVRTAARNALEAIRSGQ